MRALLAAGADVNAVSIKEATRRSRWRSTTAASKSCGRSLAADAALDRKDGKGITLMIAAFRGMLRIVRDLLEADADVLLRDNSGNDARKWAEVRGHRPRGHAPRRSRRRRQPVRK